MKLTESMLRKIIKEELKEAIDLSSYEAELSKISDQLKKIHDELIQKVKSGEVDYKQVSTLKLPDDVLAQLRRAATSYKASSRTPEEKAASVAKGKATKARYAQYRKDAEAERERKYAEEDARIAAGYAPETEFEGRTGHSGEMPNPKFYTKEPENPPWYTTRVWKLKPEYYNVKKEDLQPLWVPYPHLKK